MAVLEQGQRLGPYVIDSLVGQGGMAEVYRAVHQALERNVAIKVLNPALRIDPTFPLRFRREAKAVARLNHPNIVTVYDFGEQDDFAFLVMELATGGTLRERAEQYRTLADAVEGLAPVCDALQYAHEANIVHGDVKPINVLISERGQELLADFGLARVVTESLDFATDELSLGSPHYMAPEQIENRSVDHRADIYALGIVTYEIIAGRVPYTATTLALIIQQHLASPPPSIRSVLPDAPESLDAAIRRATAKRREERYGSVTEFLADIRRAAAEAPTLPIAASRKPQATPAAQAVAPNVLADDPNETVLLPRRPVPSATPTPTPTPTTAPVRSQNNVFGAQPAAWTSPRRRRATSFNQAQWLALGTAFLVIVFINAIGLWLTVAGRSAAEGNLASGITTYILDHLGAFKSSLAALALVLAVLAVFSMRAAVLDGHSISPALYRRLRQYHRLVGYLAIMVAFAVGFLTCVGIFGFGTKTPRAALHSALGSTLLVLIVAKIMVVRYFPSQRRHLKLLGYALLVGFFLVFATSTVPFLWSHLRGTSQSNPYNPYVGRSRP